MPPTILVVDEHQLYRTTFCMLLQMCWPTARIVEAADTSQALSLFPQHAWDCMILDSQLPMLREVDLARHLRARARGQPLPPLVLMSPQPTVATAAHMIGAATLLPKPIARADLHRALSPVLGAIHLPRSATQPHSSFELAQARPITLPALRASADTIAGPFERRISASTHIGRLQDRIQNLVQQTINRFPPPYAPVARASLLPTTRMGDYLVQRGYLTRWQLTCALRANQSPARGRIPLGFILRAHNLVPSPVLSVLLLQQFGDHLAGGPVATPRFVGEQLLLNADLAPAQLALALQEQLDDYQDGRWVRLGDILARHGWRTSTPPAP